MQYYISDYKPKRLRTGLPKVGDFYFSVVFEENGRWRYGCFTRFNPENLPWNCNGWYVDIPHDYERWEGHLLIKEAFKASDGYYWGYLSHLDGWRFMKFTDGYFLFNGKACFPDFIVDVSSSDILNPSTAFPLMKVAYENIQ